MVVGNVFLITLKGRKMCLRGTFWLRCAVLSERGGSSCCPQKGVLCRTQESCGMPRWNDHERPLIRTQATTSPFATKRSKRFFVYFCIFLKYKDLPVYQWLMSVVVEDFPCRWSPGCGIPLGLSGTSHLLWRWFFWAVVVDFFWEGVTGN